MTGIRSLITAAFGPTACLYATVLQCDRTASPSEVRRAYHRRALLHHPDKQKQRQQKRDGNTSNNAAEATLTFQAVSAAYELLSDPERRAQYDATGQLYDDGQPHDDCSSSSSRPQSRRTANDNKQNAKEKEDEQRRWKEFFHSVFQEVVTSASDAARDKSTYRGSEREVADVLRFYSLCKGDLDKVLTCIVSGEECDKARWVQEIIQPAVRRGDVPRYDQCFRGETLVDTTDEEESAGNGRSKKRIRSKRTAAAARPSDDTGMGDLVDTDDDEPSEATRLPKPSTTTTNSEASSTTTMMSKKDKMEYRVAKKRKATKEKEIEFATILKGKQWSGDVASKRRTNTFSDELLSKLENKYASSSSSGRKKAGKSVKKKRL
jgi:curved DNA-binding protein CbpA